MEIRNTVNYVRTKDEIVDISNYIDKDSYYQDTKTPDYIGKEKIIKEADNIEELCDAFIVMSGYSSRHYTFKTLRNAIKHSKLFPFEVMCIYGAIWTDKGLTYVTKMNEKEELELL